MSKGPGIQERRILGLLAEWGALPLEYVITPAAHAFKERYVSIFGDRSCGAPYRGGPIRAERRALRRLIQKGDVVVISCWDCIGDQVVHPLTDKWGRWIYSLRAAGNTYQGKVGSVPRGLPRSTAVHDYQAEMLRRLKDGTMSQEEKTLLLEILR